MRVYMIGRNYKATEIDTVEAARRFTAWLADGGNPLLAKVIQTWLWQPPDTGGLGALAESDRDVASLRTEVAALWLRAQDYCPDWRDGR